MAPFFCMYVFVFKFIYPCEPIEKYFRSWRRRRLSSFFCFDAVLKICVSSVRGDAGGYVLFPVWCISNFLAMDDGFFFEYSLQFEKFASPPFVATPEAMSLFRFGVFRFFLPWTTVSFLNILFSLKNLHLLRSWRRRRLCPFSGLVDLEFSCHGRRFLV